MGESSGRERRKLKRVIKRIPAFFMCGTLHGDGYIKNLSKEGLFMRTDLLPAPGEMVQILIQARDGHKVEVTGTVRWNTAQFPGRDPHPGFGMQIEPVTSEYRELYESILLN